MARRDDRLDGATPGGIDAAPGPVDGFAGSGIPGSPLPPEPVGDATPGGEGGGGPSPAEAGSASPVVDEPPAGTAPSLPDGAGGGETRPDEGPPVHDPTAGFEEPKPDEPDKSEPCTPCPPCPDGSCRCPKPEEDPDARDGGSAGGPDPPGGTPEQQPGNGGEGGQTPPSPEKPEQLGLIASMLRGMLPELLTPGALGSPVEGGAIGGAPAAHLGVPVGAGAFTAPVGAPADLAGRALDHGAGSEAAGERTGPDAPFASPAGGRGSGEPHPLPPGPPVGGSNFAAPVGAERTAPHEAAPPDAASAASGRSVPGHPGTGAIEGRAALPAAALHGGATTALEIPPATGIDLLVPAPSVEGGLDSTWFVLPTEIAAPAPGTSVGLPFQAGHFVDTGKFAEAGLPPSKYSQDAELASLGEGLPPPPLPTAPPSLDLPTGGLGPFGEGPIRKGEIPPRPANEPRQAPVSYTPVPIPVPPGSPGTPDAPRPPTTWDGKPLTWEEHAEMSGAKAEAHETNVANATAAAESTRPVVQDALDRAAGLDAQADAKEAEAGRLPDAHTFDRERLMAEAEALRAQAEAERKYAADLLKYIADLEKVIEAERSQALQMRWWQLYAKLKAWLEARDASPESPPEEPPEPAPGSTPVPSGEGGDAPPAPPPEEEGGGGPAVSGGTAAGEGGGTASPVDPCAEKCGPCGCACEEDEGGGEDGGGEGEGGGGAPDTGTPGGWVDEPPPAPPSPPPPPPGGLPGDRPSLGGIGGAGKSASGVSLEAGGGAFSVHTMVMPPVGAGGEAPPVAAPPAADEEPSPAGSDTTPAPVPAPAPTPPVPADARPSTVTKRAPYIDPTPPRHANHPSLPPELWGWFVNFLRRFFDRPEATVREATDLEKLLLAELLRLLAIRGRPRETLDRRTVLDVWQRLLKILMEQRDPMGLLLDEITVQPVGTLEEMTSGPFEGAETFASPYLPAPPPSPRGPHAPGPRRGGGVVHTPFGDFTEEEIRDLLQELKSVALEDPQLVLDLVGMLPVPGADLADLASAVISVTKGDFLDALLAIAASLYLFGSMTVGLARLIAKIVKFLEATGRAQKYPRLVKLLERLLALARKLGIDVGMVGRAGRRSQAVTFAGDQVRDKFKHARDFGVTGNNNSAGRQRFVEALRNHIDNKSVQEIKGTFRGESVIHYVNHHTGLNVITTPHGAFVSGWKLSPSQLSNVMARGKL